MVFIHIALMWLLILFFFAYVWIVIGYWENFICLTLWFDVHLSLQMSLLTRTLIRSVLPHPHKPIGRGCAGGSHSPPYSNPRVEGSARGVGVADRSWERVHPFVVSAVNKCSSWDHSLWPHLLTPPFRPIPGGFRNKVLPKGVVHDFPLVCGRIIWPSKTSQFMTTPYSNPPRHSSSVSVSLCYAL